LLAALRDVARWSGVGGWERQPSGVSGVADSGSARGAWAPGVFLSLALHCRPDRQTRSRRDANCQPPGIESGKANDPEFGTPGTVVRCRANRMAGRGHRWACLRVCQGPGGPPVGPPRTIGFSYNTPVKKTGGSALRIRQCKYIYTGGSLN
jgi:hypothetical protein